MAESKGSEFLAKPERDPVHCRPGSSARGLPASLDSNFDTGEDGETPTAFGDFCEKSSWIRNSKTEDMDRTGSGNSLNSEGNGQGRGMRKRERGRRGQRPRRGLEAGDRGSQGAAGGSQRPPGSAAPAEPVEKQVWGGLKASAGENIPGGGTAPTPTLNGRLRDAENSHDKASPGEATVSAVPLVWASCRPEATLKCVSAGSAPPGPTLWWGSVCSAAPCAGPAGAWRAVTVGATDTGERRQVAQPDASPRVDGGGRPRLSSRWPRVWSGRVGAGMQHRGARSRPPCFGAVPAASV